jgi:hypothetical protein
VTTVPLELELVRRFDDDLDGEEKDDFRGKEPLRSFVRTLGWARRRLCWDAEAGSPELVPGRDLEPPPPPKKDEEKKDETLVVDPPDFCMTLGGGRPWEGVLLGRSWAG